MSIQPRRWTLLWVAAVGLFLGRAAWSAEAPTSVPETVGGKVFLDANGNGKLDPGEKGLAGIRVTDGVGFATTGEDGAYSIKIGDDPVMPHKATHVVSVSWPSGKWPTGKWWARLDQIADAKQVDFGLRDDVQKRPFAFTQVTDPHGAGWSGGYAKEVERLGPAIKFVVNTGDLFYTNYSLPPEANETYRNYMKTLDGFPVPLFHSPGNHDMCGTSQNASDKKHPDYCCGVYTRFLGPVRWSFDYAGAHFASVDWKTPEPDGHYESGVPPTACDWLDKDLQPLKPNTPIVVFVHFPSSAAKFWETASKYKVTRMLGGHSHRFQRLEFGGVTATTTINMSSSASTLGVISDQGAEFVDCCPGCKRNATHHSKGCALVASDLQKLQRGRGKSYPTPERTVSNAAETIQDLGAKGVSVSLKLTPPGAGKAGLRIGDKQPVEIACTAKGLLVGGVEVPFTNGTPVQLEVFFDSTTLTVYAMPGLRVSGPRTADRPGKVTIFAEGGAAKFDVVNVWEFNGSAMPDGSGK